MSGAVFAFHGVRNFRDFGGCATADGRRIKSGELFRAAHFAQADETDIARLDALGARLVADLRHSLEREAMRGRWLGANGPPVVFRAPDAAPIPVTLNPVQAGPLDGGMFSSAVARANMIGAYRRIPADPSAIDLFGQLMRALAEQGGPVVVHCTSGKDRTGIACAIVLASLGVARDAIYADYLLTDAAMDVGERRRVVRASLAAEVDRPLTYEEIEPLLGVEGAYLDAAMAVIDQLGGVECCVEQKLGISERVRARMFAHLLE